MAQVSYRANLGASTFPFLSENQGQSIIVKQQDNMYIPAVESGGRDNQDVGIPQIYYCHNVLPTSQGYSSVGYSRVCNAVAGETGFSTVFVLRDSSENKAYFCHTTNNKNFVQLPGSSTWLQINSIAGAANKLTTVALISGVTYIYFANIGCYRYDFASNLLVPVTLNGLTPSAVIGITTTAGYMIAWTASEIAWSSTIDATDFEPSLSTGAGGGGVEGAKGSIQVCINTIAGFIVYTTSNAVAASYSGNSRYPFNFREIVGAGGLANPELASADGNSSAQYAYTTYGMQSVGIQLAQTVLPDVTDFIAGSYFEDFDDFTLQFSRQVLTGTMQKKLTLISSRYLIISYGVSSLTHALVYDIILKRYGKLKITHTDCYEYNLLNPEIIETPKKSIAFVQADGTVFLLDTTFGAANSFGVLLLGKYQYVRQRMLALDTVVLENIQTNNAFALYAQPAIDGKNVTTEAGYLLESDGLLRKYGFSTVGTNQSLLFFGGFSLVSLVLNFHVHGRST